MDVQGLKKAFENFMSDDAQVKEAIMSSTTAGFGGSGYSLELFDDGTFRVLWDGQIGNLYDSRGIIVSIPQLNEDEMPSDEEVEADPTSAHEVFYDNAIASLRETAEYAISKAV